MIADLRTRAVGVSEQMDAEDADPRALARTYAQFSAVNAVVSGLRDVYRRHVRPRARQDQLRVLDIGSGGGDLTRALARRLRRDGCQARVVGTDIDRRAMDWAVSADEDGLVNWRCASSSDLVREGESFDIVLSNHVLHHLTGEELTALLSDSGALVRAGGVVVHSDIARSRAAYLLFGAATWPLASTLLADSFIREDGLTSIRRSYTASELRALVSDGWRVEQRMPSRLLLCLEPGHGSG